MRKKVMYDAPLGEHLLDSWPPVLLPEPIDASASVVAHTQPNHDTRSTAVAHISEEEELIEEHTDKVKKNGNKGTKSLERVWRWYLFWSPFLDHLWQLFVVTGTVMCGSYLSAIFWWFIGGSRGALKVELYLTIKHGNHSSCNLFCSMIPYSGAPSAPTGPRFMACRSLHVSSFKSYCIMCVPICPST
eukprot:277082_1